MAGKRITIKITPKPTVPAPAHAPAVPLSVSDWVSKGNCSYKLNLDNHLPTYAYDFDDTLVKLRTSDILPKRSEVLAEQAKTHNILIFSNQGGIEDGKTTHVEVRRLMDEFAAKIGILCSFFYASADDHYRKPCTGMIQLLSTLSPTKIEWYCGDAAGRPADFSISDLYFANNAGIRFVTPEEVFNSTVPRGIASKQKPLYARDLWIDGIQTKSYDVVPVISTDEAMSRLPAFDAAVRYLIIMVGSQGCGKSSLSAALSSAYGFGIINGDKMKTMTKMQSVFNTLKSDPKVRGIVIDNTNYKKETRTHWLSQKEGFTVIMVYFKIAKDHTFHLTRYREHHGGSHISAVAIHTKYKHFEAPVAAEADDFIELTSAVSSTTFDHKLRFAWR